MLSQTQKHSPRLLLMTRLMALCWIVTKLLCYRLWLSDRLFPLVPIDDSLLNIPSIVHTVLFIAILVSLAALFLFPSKKWIGIIIIIVEIASCLLDQNRWQPWEYQFTFMMAAYIFLNAERRIITCWQIIFIGIYFFSGVNKLNHGFILQIWSARIMNQMLGITLHNIWLYRLGWLLPLFEILGAIALLFNHTRKAGVIMLCGMHLFILIMIDPVRNHFKPVIGPWNVLMCYLLIALFYKDRFHYRDILHKHFFTAVIILCWWILPWLHFFGLWDSYLSSSLYSGKTQYLYICTSNIKTKRLLKDNFIHTTHDQPCDTMISVFDWSMRELNTSPTGELRVFKKIITQWEMTMDSTGSDRFFVHFPTFSDQKWVELAVEK